MKIKVANRDLAKVIKFDIPYIVISIYSTGGQPADIPLHPKCIAVLPIQFDDVEEDEWMYGDTIYKPITEEKAERIWEFVDTWKSDAELILVHCDGGICRSPAVAAAISRVYKGEDKEWFKKPYLPNMKVYNTMLKVKGLSNSYE